MVVTHSIRALRSDAKANRESILTAARTALAQDPRASIDLIARTAGLSRRALYGHFDDRSALIRELIATGAARFNLLADDLDDDDARLALARLAVRLWRAAADVRVIAALALDDEHLVSTAAALAPVRRVLGEILRRGQADGSLRQDIDADDLTHLIEEIARSVVTRADAFADAGDVAVRSILGAAGLSWRETAALLDAYPDLLVDENA